MNPSCIKVLVVDDEPICREAVMEILRSRGGYQVLSSSNGADALLQLAGTHVDLALLDVSMPQIDGLTLLGMLRADERHARLPVILLTDHASEDMVRQAGSLGVAGYLLKSAFTPDALLSRVQGAIRSAPSGPSSPAQTPPSRKFTAPPPPPARAAAPQPLPTGSAPSRASVPAAGASMTARPGHTNPSGSMAQRSKTLQIVKRRLELQAVSPIVSEVIRLTSERSGSVHEVVEVVRQDGALALRVIKVANSSLYSTGTRAKTLAEAAGRLGLQGIRSAVATAGAAVEFSQATSGGLVPQRTWEHALTVALMARFIAMRILPELEGDIYVAGLLHDIGRLVLCAAMPDQFGAAMAAADKASRDDLNAVEHEAFGLTHADVTRLALERRGLDAAMVDAAAMHELPIEALKNHSHSSPAPLIIALANRLAHAFAFGDGGSPTLLPLVQFVRSLDLDDAVIAEIGRNTARQLSESELYHSCFSNVEFRPPLSKELAGMMPRAPRVKVMSSDPHLDAPSIFISELGWSVKDDEEILVVSGSDQPTMSARFDAHVRAKGPARTPVLFISDDAQPITTTQPTVGCTHRHLSLPVRYSRLVETIKSMHQASVVEMAAHC